MTDVDEVTDHLTPDEKRIFRLNMIKLADILRYMKLTVDERHTLTELVRTYFQNKTPPPLPWRRD